MGLDSLNAVLVTMKEVTSFIEKKHAKNQKVIGALISIQTAIIETRNFIDSTGYEPNKELSKLWLDAFGKVKIARIYTESDFPKYLYDKARFWGDPKKWLREPGAMELIPTLNDLDGECDSLLVRLTK